MTNNHNGILKLNNACQFTKQNAHCFGFIDDTVCKIKLRKHPEAKVPHFGRGQAIVVSFPQTDTG